VEILSSRGLPLLSGLETGSLPTKLMGAGGPNRTAHLLVLLLSTAVFKFLFLFALILEC